MPSFQVNHGMTRSLAEEKSSSPVEWKTAVFSALSANSLPCEQLNNNCQKNSPSRRKKIYRICGCKSSYARVLIKHKLDSRNNDCFENFDQHYVFYMNPGVRKVFKINSEICAQFREKTKLKRTSIILNSRLSFYHHVLASWVLCLDSLGEQNW